jgi:hypothetical protein
MCHGASRPRLNGLGQVCSRAQAAKHDPLRAQPQEDWSEGASAPMAASLVAPIAEVRPRRSLEVGRADHG